MNKTIMKNPATNEILGECDTNSVDDLKQMISNARKTQIEWQKMSVRERTKKVLNIRKYLVNNSEKIAEIISKDNGKTKIDALATEVLPAAMAISYYCKNAEYFLRDEFLSAGNIFLLNKRSKIVRVPFGVVGIISPWNYPFAIPFSEVIMALLAGNAVILKVASETQLVGQEIKNAVESANLPDGIFNYINLPGKIAGNALLENGIDKLFFTGSVAVGKYLMKKASETLTPLVLELGGNDPMIVCEDADPYRAAMGAIWAGFQNAGQSCGGVERIYVHEKIYDLFMSILKSKIEKLKIGYGENYNNDIGCMTTKNQVDTVKIHIEDALNKGALLFAQSSQVEKGEQFLPAMVFTNVNHDMLLMKDETFGPVVGVMKFSNYEEAINLANDSYLGLTASVWTKSKKRGEKIARQLKAGAVTINDHLMSHGLAETPWGGFKQSGIGRTHGKLGFDEMTQPQVIVHDILPFVKKDLWWHPFNKNLYMGLKGLLDLLYSYSITLKIKGIKSLIKILPRIFREE
ncbi:aldehyde dehydrogenase family protein [Stygiobacter electus]|uniref:Aldehyde dehydrogenase n=1 Tax=Stygiobacter electus TaxID=3032292 RepID=A0AAE3P0Q6_9BACT|nr:aldehyde dehydrogenase family protein [Stygiobacter electus]MDF1610690.1 aldehyde dehydrogenase family protein [Stygiobacter electus]